MEGVMKTDRNQLTSVGWHSIGSLSDALPEKEVFQSALIFRDGTAKPLLAEEMPSFHSTTAVTLRSEENRGSDVTIVRTMQVAKASATNCKSLHKSDVSHRLYVSSSSTMLGA